MGYSLCCGICMANRSSLPNPSGHRSPIKKYSFHKVMSTEHELHKHHGKGESEYLNAPTSPHIVVATNRLTITHETKVHSWSNQITVESQVHTAHWEKRSLWDGHDSIHIPSVPLLRLDELGGGIVIRDVEPETMGNSSGYTFTKTERVSTDEVSAFTVRIVQGVEEQWSRWAEKILDVLLKCVHCFPRWVLSNLYTIHTHQWKCMNETSG